MASKHLPRRAKTKGGLEKCLANPGSRQKITKTTHAVRGLQTKWEIPVNDNVDLPRDPFVDYPKKISNGESCS